MKQLLNTIQVHWIHETVNHVLQSIYWFQQIQQNLIHHTDDLKDFFHWLYKLVQ